MRSIDLTPIRDMDAGLCTGWVYNPISMVIRARTAGILNTFNTDIATHAFFFVTVAGRFMIAEMEADGLKLNPADEYTHKNLIDDWPIKVIRHPVFNDDAIRAKAAAQLVSDCHESIKYDYAGLLRFIFPELQDQDPKEFYCSELIKHYIRLYGGAVIDPIDGAEYQIKDEVCPYGLQKSPSFSTVETWCA